MRGRNETVEQNRELEGGPSRSISTKRGLWLQVVLGTTYPSCPAAGPGPGGRPASEDLTVNPSQSSHCQTASAKCLPRRCALPPAAVSKGLMSSHTKDGGSVAPGPTSLCVRRAGRLSICQINKQSVHKDCRVRRWARVRAGWDLDC